MLEKKDPPGTFKPQFSHGVKLNKDEEENPQRISVNTGTTCEKPSFWILVFFNHDKGNRVGAAWNRKYVQTCWKINTFTTSSLCIRSPLPVCVWNMGHGGLCYLNQRATDSQPAGPGVGSGSLLPTSPGDMKWVGKGRKQEKRENKIIMRERIEKRVISQGEGMARKMTERDIRSSPHKIQDKRSLGKKRSFRNSTF